MLLSLWLVLLLPWLFLLGAAVGSFLNVCIYRIPLGKSLLWPGSHCGSCFREVRLKDNIPLVSYWVLRGRCRDCGAAFSVRYFWVELLTAVTFVVLYLVEIGLNVHRLPLWNDGGFSYLRWTQFPPCSWPLFVLHAALACFLIVAMGCLLDRGQVPAPVIVTGTLVGLAGAVLFPWPYPDAPAVPVIESPRSEAIPLYVRVDGGTPARPLRGPMPPEESWATWRCSPRPGFYAWPAWGPLPPGLAPGSWQLGLATGLAGMLVGGWSLRLTAWATGRDTVAGLGAITGAFLGWQPTLLAIVLALPVSAALSRWPRAPGVGLCLVLSIVGVGLGWAWVAPLVRPVFFSAAHMLALLFVAVAGLALTRLLASRDEKPHER
jgi:leader peptidase (prepilin peptidase)/N-methyltransferase